MAIVRFDPFRELDRLQSEVNRLFEGVNGYEGRPLSSGAAQNGALAPRTFAPSVDVAETQNEVVLRAELPGIRPDDVDIELTGDTLTLRGERKFENEERRNDFVRVERSYGRFQRSFTLGVPVQNDQVTANYKDGVLEIHLPKSEATRPRKVQVSVEGGSQTQPQPAMAGGSSQSDAPAASSDGAPEGASASGAAGAAANN